MFFNKTDTAITAPVDNLLTNSLLGSLLKSTLHHLDNLFQNLEHQHIDNLVDDSLERMKISRFLEVKRGNDRQRWRNRWNRRDSSTQCAYFIQQ